jgi:uncharacterized membrane protein (DUF4010 family)
VDREKKKATDHGGIGGIRTFILVALVGATSAWLGIQLKAPGLFVAVQVAAAAMIIAGYFLQARHNPESVGLTTEFAAISVGLLGGLAVSGSPGLAVALGIVVSATLAYKQPLHDLVGKIGTDDIYAGLKLLIATFIVLPMLPNQAMGPWNALNPYKLWLLVVLISALSLVGYVATRALGEGRGLALTGVTGGLVSSTAVTLSFAKQGRERGQDPGVASALSLGILLAWAVMFGRVVVLVAVVNPALVMPLLVPYSLMGAATGVLAFFLYRRAARSAAGAGTTAQTVPLQNPFSLTSASKFALLFALVMLLVKGVQIVFPGRGLYMVAAVAGLTDVDAITLSMADFAKQGGALRVAVAAITIAALANTVVKAGLVASLGSRQMRRPIVIATVLILASGLVALALA